MNQWINEWINKELKWMNEKKKIKNKWKDESMDHWINEYTCTVKAEAVSTSTFH